MNRIDWKIGFSYEITDMCSVFHGILIGYVVNQIPISWKDKSSYSNHHDNTTYLLLRYYCKHTNSERFVLALPRLGGYVSNRMDDVPYSDIRLQGMEYGDSIDELLKKLRQNWVCTTKLSYDATYKEGYKDEELYKYYA